MFFSLNVFSEKNRDYANYKDWQILSEKSHFLQLWENTELEFLSFDSEIYVNKIEELKSAFEVELNGQKTFEFEQEKNEAAKKVLGSLEKLQKAAESGVHKEISLCRIETNLAIIGYVNLKANIMDHNTDSMLFLFLVLFVILVLFVVSTAVFATRLKHSRKNEKSTSDFNQKIIEAQEKERKRISLELHDTIAQNLRAIQLLTSQAFSAGGDEDELSEIKKQVLELESKSIIDIRTLCYNLTPPDLDRKDLRSAITHFCSTFKRDTKIDCSLVITDDFNFANYSPENQLNIFRLIQEALTNAAKHSKAEEITVVIRKDNSNNSGGSKRLRILITDDGVGFNLESASFLDSHFGLKGMKERTKFLNGTLKINTAPDEGTEVQIAIPYKEE
ncbi:MAG: sensor histidine kinase [Treponema sp.]|nr:sensor histidine kinase [Candidatus Treponema equifaecale]